MSNFFSSFICKLFLLLAIMNTFYHDDANAVHSPLIYETEGGRYDHTSDSAEHLGGILRYSSPQNPTGNFKEIDSFKEIIESLTPSEKRDTLAYLLKQRYREFRKKLEETSSMEMRPTPQPLPKIPNNWSFRRKPVEEGPNLPILTAAAFRDSSNSLSNILKQMRSADESPSPIRSSGLRPDAHPFPVAPLQVTFPDRTPNNAESVLDDRLGPSAEPTFDPSIVVDFNSLLQLTRRLQRLQKAESSKETGVGHIGDQVYVQHKSRPNVKVFRRKLSTLATAKNEEEKPKRQLNRAKVLQMPTNSHLNFSSSSSDAPIDDFSMFISMGEMKGSSPMEAAVDDNKITNEFGPFSQGNDPTAGIHPSQVSVPEIDLMQLRLPQGVRDTLRNYLKPIISGLKPLRKNVPGLPGLDYPILSVVPYTNFYCSNMPWPGFYADTEARCQSWHACDVDGRQSTFLCPNGTVFNQALMVCDWWYNVDCLVTKYLYPLNERLFGTFKLEDTAKLQTRITPELLDTIFVR